MICFWIYIKHAKSDYQWIASTKQDNKLITYHILKYYDRNHQFKSVCIQCHFTEKAWGFKTCRTNEKMSTLTRKASRWNNSSRVVFSYPKCIYLLDNYTSTYCFILVTYIFSIDAYKWFEAGGVKTEDGYFVVM